MVDRIGFRKFKNYVKKSNNPRKLHYVVYRRDLHFTITIKHPSLSHLKVYNIEVFIAALNLSWERKQLNLSRVRTRAETKELNASSVSERDVRKKDKEKVNIWYPSKSDVCVLSMCVKCQYMTNYCQHSSVFLVAVKLRKTTSVGFWIFFWFARTNIKKMIKLVLTKLRHLKTFFFCGLEIIFRQHKQDVTHCS